MACMLHAVVTRSSASSAQQSTALFLCLDAAIIVLAAAAISLIFLPGGVLAVVIVAVCVAIVLSLYAVLMWGATGRWLSGWALGARAIDRATGYPSLRVNQLETISMRKTTPPSDPLAFPDRPANITLSSAPAPWAKGTAAATTRWVLTSDQHPDVEIRQLTVIGRVPSGEGTYGGAAETAIVDVARSLSRTHALLEPDADGIYITDLGSTNGSWVQAQAPQTDDQTATGERESLLSPGAHRDDGLQKLAANVAVRAAHGSRARFGEVEFTLLNVDAISTPPEMKSILGNRKERTW
jgi:hypothetical protein